MPRSSMPAYILIHLDRSPSPLLIGTMSSWASFDGIARMLSTRGSMQATSGSGPWPILPTPTYLTLPPTVRSTTIPTMDSTNPGSWFLPRLPGSKTTQ
ncbi:hypothetical protein L249_0219 [Ophiocordyceps polyrhachis-furcata BCC 54312]|uniref:Uncharacterized protein n=1 Tax=Ophiocordyceps polyrhachis-furcata BCC 54312 TaxID=1330021 RepID=A0A367LD73_9HYPO|nr:hypothetical protein L249_0219 [Ophiocordyceps polyrhachis-furcata BCC 54312]